MGWRAAEDLKQNGIQAFVIQDDLSPEQAVGSIWQGILDRQAVFVAAMSELGKNDYSKGSSTI